MPCFSFGRFLPFSFLGRLGLINKNILIKKVINVSPATIKIKYFSETTSKIFSNIKNAIVKTKFNVDVLPSSTKLAGAAVELVMLDNRHARLRSALNRVNDNYDFIFIDCPPALDLLTINALSAADTVLVPIQCEFFALEGLSELMNTIRLVKQHYNKYIDIEGVLLTMFDGRLNLTLQVVEEVKKYFPNKVYKTTIPRNVRLSEAPSFGEPINFYDASSKGAKAYAALADEVLSQNR